MPTGWQPGDVVYVGYELTSSTGSVTVPAGWVQAVPQFRSASSTSSLSGVLRRVMQAGDPNSLTISHTSGRFAAGPFGPGGASDSGLVFGVVMAALAVPLSARPSARATFSQTILRKVMVSSFPVRRPRGRKLG